MTPPRPKPPRPLPAWSWHPIELLALGFGSGRAPVAPGTFGTLVGVLFYLPLAPTTPLVYATVTALLFLVGLPICGLAARRFGVHDHPAIVWDEIVGYLVTMLPISFGLVAASWGSWGAWPWIVAGFLLFRLFDIWKPWPIGWLDRRVHGGLGIMVDDLLAGLYAAAVMVLIARAMEWL